MKEADTSKIIEIIALGKLDRFSVREIYTIRDAEKVLKRIIFRMLLMVIPSLSSLLMLLFWEVSNGFLVSLVSSIVGFFCMLLLFGLLKLSQVFILKKSINSLPLDADKILRPPGSFVMMIINHVYPKKFSERVFSPIIADIHVEYFEALDRGHDKKAVWIQARGVMMLSFVAISQLPATVLDIFTKLIKVS